MLRRRSIKKLSSLLEKYGAASDSIVRLKSEISDKRTSVLFVLAYDINVSPYNEIIQNFIEKKLANSYKVGASTLNPKPDLKMKAWLRDNPAKDFAEFIDRSKDFGKQQSALDAIVTAIDLFEDHGTDDKIMIVVANELNVNGFAKVEDLNLIYGRGIKVNLMIREGAKKGDGVMKGFEEIGSDVESFTQENLEKVLNSVFKNFRN